MTKIMDRPSLRAATSLASRITGLGIEIPDQALAAHKMEASRLGLSPSASPRRVWMAWMRRIWSDKYRGFSYERFDSVADAWGGRMPIDATVVAERIEARLPEVVLKVFATEDDPWLVAFYNGERVILRGWMRKSQYAPSIMIPLA